MIQSTSFIRSLIRRRPQLLALALLVLAPLRAEGQGRTAPANSAELHRILDSAVARFPGTMGIWVKHLTTGEEAGVRADSLFNSASVIKLPVLALAMQQVDAGALSLESRITVTAADVRGGSGILRLFDAGLQPTLRDVLTQMVVTSDNTATDLAIAKVGGVEAVNAWLRRSGYADGMQLTMTTGELFAKYAALPAGSSRDAKTIGDRSYWLGAMTPRGTGRLLEAMQQCADGKQAAPALASVARCADMIQMMRSQLSGQRRLPHFVTVSVAHKTGDFPPVLANDVGILFTRSGPVVISLFANAIQGSYAEAEDLEGRLAQRIVAYFSGSR